MESNTSASPSDLTLSQGLDEACRILTISASLDAARTFVERLKALSSSSTIPHPPSSSSTSHVEMPYTVPYTLSNKYYAADVHFALYPLEAASSIPHLFSPLDERADRKLPPAVVFVWVDGEPYAKQIEQLSRAMALGGYEAEVALAVRIPKVDSISTTTGQETRSTLSAAKNTETQTQTADDNDDKGEHNAADNADIDSTLMSFGFEYVDATLETSRSESRDADADDNIDIPRLPRVLDALSTIMWPSMSSSGNSKAAGSSRKPSAPLSSAQQKERDAIMAELISVSEISGLGGWNRSVLVGEVEDDEFEEGSEMDGEGEEAVFSPYDFERGRSTGSMGYLEDGQGKGGRKKSARPWLSSGTATSNQTGTALELGSVLGGASPDRDAGGMTSSPTDMEALSPFGDLEGKSRGRGKKISIGFDDDFTVFVSAPAAALSGPSSKAEGAPPLDLDLSDDDDGETPLQTAIPDSELTGDSLRIKHLGLGHDLHTQYTSLGSVSDFGGSDFGDFEHDHGDEEDRRKGYEALGEDADGHEWEDENDNEDQEEWEDAVEEGGDSWDGDEEGEEGLPTKDEIRETAVRIFGGVPQAKGKTKTEASGSKAFGRASDLLKEQVEKEKETPNADTDQAKSTSEMTERMRRLGGMAAAADTRSAFGPGPSSSSLEGDDEDARPPGVPVAPFDLERVLHSLQTMRSEIAGMEDEDEKRRMAARVALGLVYGLEGMDEDDI